MIFGGIVVLGKGDRDPGGILSDFDCGDLKLKRVSARNALSKSLPWSIYIHPEPPFPNSLFTVSFDGDMGSITSSK